MKRWILAGTAMAVIVILALFVPYTREAPVATPRQAPESIVKSPPSPVENVTPPSEKTVVTGITNKTPQAGVKEGMKRPDRWTEKTLAGTTWKAEGFDFAFGKDGTWHMAGRQASKWRVEGDRIKLFNDKGEVHYLDIEGDELTFNGESIGHPVARE